MLTAEENQTLTRVGPNTPMGKLLRRYWHPVAAVFALNTSSVIAIEFLGELGAGLALLRGRSALR